MEAAGILIGALTLAATLVVLWMQLKAARQARERNDVSWSIDGTRGHWVVTNIGLDSAFDVRIVGVAEDIEFDVQRAEVPPGGSVATGVSTPDFESMEYFEQTAAMLSSGIDWWRVTWRTPLGTWSSYERP